MTANRTQSELMTPDEAATALRLDAVSKDPRRTVMKMARESVLESRRVGKWIMITRDSVDKVLNGGVVNDHAESATTEEARE